ncbi:growth arrest-specific protein 1-like [Ornithodoros turicata]|uniref:growth arrest-specific protein 1-like n=1 Tax=Ornithodoros turicata TaxID=34597 RepID=UPI003138AEF4
MTSWTILVTSFGVLLSCVLASSSTTEKTCEELQLKCAHRKGCGTALHAYMYQCAAVLSGRTTKCPWPCQRALAALTSTDEGRELSTCRCGDSDVCKQSKQNVEVCRAEVERLTAPGAKIPCSIAYWICEAEPQCGAALGYYYRYCRSMFHGKKCTARCNNSLAILNRQPKADTLRSCYCDGTEDFTCQKIRANTEKLCYRNDKPQKKSSGVMSTSQPVQMFIWIAVITVHRCTALRLQIT